MQRLSFPTVTILSNKITRNEKVLSFKDSLRKPLGRRSRFGPVSFPSPTLSIQTLSLPLRSPFFRVGKCNMAFYLWKYRERKGGSRKGGRKKGGGVSKEVELVVVQQQRGTGILFTKHDSSIFRQSFNPRPCMWFMEEASQFSCVPNRTESNLFQHGETTYRVGCMTV